MANSELPVNLKGSTLIIPAVSIGNVSQLASDLLLHNLKFKRIGHLEDDYLYPFASPVDYVDTPIDGISTGLEIHYSKQYNLTLILQRSPIIPSFTANFVKEIIIPFIHNHEFDQVLILDSSDSGLTENLIPSTIVTYTNEDLLSKSIESLKLNNVKNIGNYEHSKYVKFITDEINGKITLNVHVIYVYEGENFYEANVLAHKVTESLDIEIDQFKKPKSWTGVYGDKPIPNAMEEGIYG